MTVRILTGDCRDLLKTLPEASVHCIVTSPPYYGLRDYGTAEWKGGDPSCEHVRLKRGASTIDGGQYQAREIYAEKCGICGAVRVDRQIGLEATPDAFIAGMVEVFRECRRVLRYDGTLWLNIGDSYASGGRKTRDPGQSKIHPSYEGDAYKEGLRPDDPEGVKPKDLLGIPWMLAFALRADGWYLRHDIIWAKPNPMPESVRDRCTKAHEYLFLLSKSPRYYFDQSAIAQPVADATIARLSQPNLAAQAGSDRVPGKTNGTMKAVPPASHHGGRFDRGKTAKHQQDRAQKGPRFGGSKYGDDDSELTRTKSGNVYEFGETRNRRSVWTVATQPFKESHFATFPPALIEPCILAGCPGGGVVLDPFGGAGTTGLVADRLQRDAILIELNPEYVAIAERRIRGDAPLFAEVGP